MFKMGDERYEKLLDGGFPRGLGIQVYRKIIGLTQEELGDALGVTASCVSAWENGRASVSPERLESIAQVLGVSVERLLNPDVGDTEKASHLALYKGTQMHRMVLSVSHEGKDSKWPEKWKGPDEMYTPEEVERFWGLKDRASQRESLTPRIYVGHNGLFSCRVDGTNWRLTRRPKLVDVLYSINDERITLGIMLHCLRMLNFLRAKDVAEVINGIMGFTYIDPSSYGNVEYGRGEYAEDFNVQFDLLAGLEDYYKVQRMTIMGLTTEGRVQLKAML